MAVVWTQEMLDALATSDANTAIAARFGITPGVVAGKRFRLRNAGQIGIARAEPAPLPERKMAVASPPKKPKRGAEKAQPKPVITGSRTCQYPLNDGRLATGAKGWLFCSEAAVQGRPYCAEHCAQCYRQKDEEE